MARTISVLYRDADETMIEHVFGSASRPLTELQARTFAQRQTKAGSTNIVMRCTYPDPKNPRILLTAWAEPFDDEPNATPEPSSALRECLEDIITYTLPQLLLDIERAVLRGETLTHDWFEQTLIGIDREICAVL